jgi:hypothetical protein
MIEAWAIRILLVVLAGIGAWAHGYDAGKDKVQAKWDAAVAEASKKLQAEKDRLRAAEDQLRKTHAEELASVNGRLDAALAGLRNRPPRPAGVPETPRASCQGANGPELAGVHAEFLARYAAQAAKQDAALAACYASIDAARANSVTP